MMTLFELELVCRDQQQCMVQEAFESCCVQKGVCTVISPAEGSTGAWDPLIFFDFTKVSQGTPLWTRWSHLVANLVSNSPGMKPRFCLQK